MELFARLSHVTSWDKFFVAECNTQESKTGTMTTAVKWRQCAAVIIQGESGFVIYECDNETG